MKEVTKVAAPSILPEATVRPPKPEEVVPDIREYIDDKATLSRLAEITEYQRHLGDEISRLNKERRPYTDEIKRTIHEFMITGHGFKAMVNGIKLQYFNAQRRTIKADALTRALLARNFQPLQIAEIINESTVVADAFTLRVGGGDDE